MKTSNIDIAWAVLKFLTKKENGTETNPLKLGNAEFWVTDKNEMVYWPATSQWDINLIQNDIDARAAKWVTPQYKDELYAFLEPLVQE